MIFFFIGTENRSKGKATKIKMHKEIGVRGGVYQPHAMVICALSWQVGGKSSSRHFAFQTKAKLKLRDGLLHILRIK